MEDKFVGKRLDGRYEIHQLVGTGGMAHVYKAYDKQEDRWVAVKILKEEYTNNNEFLRRFRNESKAIAMLSHSNIVKVFDVSFGDRIQYIVMEYISGITLKDYINRTGVLSWKDAMYFTYQVLKALDHAHSKGIIHRDIKPQNIILLKDGSIKVTDFGIARFAQNETQTMTDRALGSVHYIPPEQARGDYTNNKADIYSLGVMMYEMLSGKLPFEADNAVSVALMQIQATAVNPREINPEIPAGLEEITMKAMEKNPAMRFQSAQAMLEDLDRFRKNPAIVFNYAEDVEATREIELASLIGTQNQAPINREVKRVQAPVYNDNYEYEEEFVKSKRQAKGSMVVTGIIAAILIALVAFGSYLVWDYFQKPEVPEDVVIDEVLVPNFVGKIYQDEIDGNVAYEDFKFEVQPVYDEEKTIGEITRQSPSNGITVKIGKVITLYVVSEKEPGQEIAVPGTVGQLENIAYNAILNAGLVPDVQHVNNEYTEAGAVINTQPLEGTMVEPGSTVVIYISKGPAAISVSIPGVIGEDIEYAKELLKSVNLVPGEIKMDEESEEDAGVVIRCSPDVGTRITEGGSVDLVVSAGKVSEKVVEAFIPLPENAKKELEIKIFVDGVKQEQAVINPLLIHSYGTQFKGKSGQKQVVVYLDGQTYMFAKLNFDKNIPSFEIESVYPYDNGEPEPDPESKPESSQTTSEVE